MKEVTTWLVKPETSTVSVKLTTLLIYSAQKKRIRVLEVLKLALFKVGLCCLEYAVVGGYFVCLRGWFCWFVQWRTRHRPEESITLPHLWLHFTLWVFWMDWSGWLVGRWAAASDSFSCWFRANKTVKSHKQLVFLTMSQSVLVSETSKRIDFAGTCR